MVSSRQLSLVRAPAKIAQGNALSCDSVSRKSERVRLIIFRIRDLGVAGSNPVPGTTTLEVESRYVFLLCASKTAG
jgi:hypothetical protein